MSCRFPNNPFRPGSIVLISATSKLATTAGVKAGLPSSCSIPAPPLQFLQITSSGRPSGKNRAEVAVPAGDGTVNHRNAQFATVGRHF